MVSAKTSRQIIRRARIGRIFKELRGGRVLGVLLLGLALAGLQAAHALQAQHFDLTAEHPNVRLAADMT